MESLPIVIALVAGIGFGIAIHIFMMKNRKPVYLVVSAEVRNEEALEPYRQQAVPLAEAAGLEILGSGEIELMEGDWDHFPALTLEKFDSKAALHKFWYSQEYQQAKKLREGHLDVQFIVALEGV
jgi:uncharacterized protein (DUF1330 family)